MPRDALFAALFFTLPLVITLFWGTYLIDEAYSYLSQVRDVAGAPYFLDGTPLEWGAKVLQSPGYTMTLLIMVWIGLPLLQSAVVVSALGWGMAAITIFVAGRLSQHSLAGSVGALLVGLAPIFLDTLATQRAWFLAFVLLAAVVTWLKFWKLQTVLLILALLTYFAPLSWL